VPPDCLTTWENVIPKWAESGLLMPLDEFMTPVEWEQFQREVYPAVLKVGGFQGKLYGVTTGLDVYACYARADHLRERGLDPSRPPETLEELYEWGRKLDRYEPGGRLIRAGFLNPTWPCILATYGPAFGAGLYDWESGTLQLNTPDNLRALETVFGQRERMGVTNVIRFEGGLSALSSTGSWPFLAGAYSITVDGQWRVEQIARYTPDLDYVTFPIPPPRGGNKHAGWAHGNFMLIPAGAKQPKGAWEFIKFWSGIEEPERAAELYTMGGWLPMSPRIAEAAVYREYVRQHPQFQTFLDVMPSEHLDPAPPVPYQQYLWDRMLLAGESVMNGSATPKAALERLEQEIRNELAARKLMGYEP
jgi:multiple sugar transport system substrate-binding protein